MCILYSRLHSVFQHVSKGIFYFVRITLLSQKPHLEALCWLTLLECSPNRLRCSRISPVQPPVSDPKEAPAHFRVPVPAISGAACFPGSLWEGLSPVSPEPLPLGWGSCLQAGSREGTTLLHLAPYFVFTHLSWWGGDPQEIQVPFPWTSFQGGGGGMRRAWRENSKAAQCMVSQDLLVPSLAHVWGGSMLPLWWGPGVLPISCMVFCTLRSLSPFCLNTGVPIRLTFLSFFKTWIMLFFFYY